MVLSLDCSTTAIGWSVFDEDDLIDYGRIIPTVDDLEWRDRVHNLLPQLEELIKYYNPIKIYQEQVPMGGQGGNLVLSQLFYVQGAFRVLEDKYVNDIEYIEVGTWRKNLDINSGDQHRDSKKLKAINKADELFDLGLINGVQYTKKGKPKFNGMDDIADSLCVYASTREKYKVVKKTFGRR